MSTAGGPKLKGIGRSGDSDIVLCLDAHDAGSYPGEPTTNLIPYYSSRNTALVASVFTAEALWTSRADSTDVIAPDGSSTTTKAVAGTTGGPYLYKYMDATFGVTMASSTAYTLSVWAKTTSTASTAVSLAFQDRGNGQYALSSKTITTEWQRFSMTITTGSGATSNTLIGWNSPTNSRTFYFWGWQVEQKGYATPYVVSQLLDPSAQGPAARPASVNLMIHGDVGTGQTFSDSSPSKHTITTVGNTTHSTAQSKFSGGSVYFDGTGDKLTLASSTDWAVGATATIDCWVYPTDAYTTNHRLWCVNNNSTHLDGYIASNGYFYMHGGIIQANTQTFPRNVWTHIAVTYNSGAVKIYFNGVSQSLAGTTTGYNISGTGQLHIGNFFSGSYEYAGYMDEFRITKGTALWTSAFTPPTRRNLSAPVVDLSGSDSGGNFNTKDMTDVATYRDGQVIEPVASAVWDFDGTDDWVSLPNDIGYTDAVSVFAWVKRDTNTGILGGYHVICGTVGLELSFEAVSNYLRNGIEVNGTRYVSNDGSTIGTGTWHYVGFTWSTSDYSKKSYIDGVNVGTQSTGSTGTSSYSFSGRSLGMWGGASYALNGKIAAYQVYDTALTAQQVKQNFNSQRSRFKV
jgi:hypothetical protein